MWSPSRLTLSMAEFCSVNRPAGLTSLNCSRFVSLTTAPPDPGTCYRTIVPRYGSSVYRFLLLEHPSAGRHLAVRREEHHLAGLVRHPEHQDLALEARNPFGREVHHRDHLPADEALHIV